MDSPLADDVRTILRELLAELGATSARVTREPDERSGVPGRTLPLGGGEFLRVELGARSASPAVDAALEHAARALRAAGRRWEAVALPELVVTSAGSAGPSATRVRERIGAYLLGLAEVPRAQNAVLIDGRGVIASGRALTELEADRWPFIVRRVAAARPPGSSHGELADPDFLALELWYGVTLIVFFEPPYAVDFARHRTRHVARELVALLPMLEPDPAAPAAVLEPPPGA